MVSAGYRHTVLVRSDGSAVACGENSSGQCDIPQLERGMRYTQASAGCGHTVLLRSDGTAVACGDNSAGQCDIPPLEKGIRYTQVSAGGAHSVLLRSDGKVAACGSNLEGQCDTTWLDEKITYAQVSAGMFHTMLLQSDGLFVILSNIDSIGLGYLFLSPLNEGIFHAQTSAGCYHTVLLHSDGNADGFSRDGNADAFHACNIPPLDEDMKYTQIDAGYYHTVLLRSDGNAIACGGNSAGQCDIPPLDGEMSYIQVSAGAEHTVLLRSDGNVVACGRNDEGQCDIPSLKSWREFFSRQDARCRYICDSHPGYPLIGFLVVQADFVCEGDAVKLICSNLAGEETLRLDACRSDLLWDTYKRIAHELKVDLHSLRVVLSDGKLLAEVCHAHPVAVVADVSEPGKHLTSWSPAILKILKQLRLACPIFDGKVPSRTAWTDSISICRFSIPYARWRSGLKEWACWNVLKLGK